jgi:hypothetical protein
MNLNQLSPNFHELRMKKTSIYFSYAEPIAFYDVIAQVYVITDNIWSRTTGKHINNVKRTFPENHIQVPHDEFRTRLKDYDR